VLGLAASAASVIAMAGDNPDRRVVVPDDPQRLGAGDRQPPRHARVADFLEPFDRALADVYVARSGQKLEDVQAAMDAETWFNGSQAVELGYADALLAADEVATTDEPAPEGDKVKAIRRVEAALTKEMPRSAAFDLINKIKGARATLPRRRHERLCRAHRRG
jgi:ATP-dependent Clp protease protease subunit